MGDVEVYARNATRFFERYESLSFEQAHASVLGVLPEQPGTVLDVGAGSGRDAAWFAARGSEVFAVEPAGALRDRAAERHGSARIHWVDDALPDLPRIRRGAARFDLIWLSAVWMHVPPGQRARAFRILADLLAPGGRLFVSLRHGAFDDGRTAHPVAAEELLRLGREHGMVCVHHAVGEGASRDALGRADVRWESLILELPEDGSGAFPTLHNVILNDAESGTCKLALLRSLLRIASGSTGYATADGNGYVLLPLGLVAPYWLRLYPPLLAAGLRQRPDRRGLGFAKASFRALTTPSPDPKSGLPVPEARGATLHGALRDAAHMIRTMPAIHIPWGALAPERSPEPPARVPQRERQEERPPAERRSLRRRPGAAVYLVDRGARESLVERSSVLSRGAGDPVLGAQHGGRRRGVRRAAPAARGTASGAADPGVGPVNRPACVAPSRRPAGGAGERSGSLSAPSDRGRTPFRRNPLGSVLPP